MRHLIVGLGLLMMWPLCSLSEEADQLHSVCELTTHGTSLDGFKIRVRARLVVREHSVTLEDAKCPRVVVLARRTDGGPDLLLCDNDGLARRFGCPADSRRGIVATFRGLYVAVDHGAPRLYVEGISDFSERLSRGIEHGDP